MRIGEGASRLFSLSETVTTSWLSLLAAITPPLS